LTSPSRDGAPRRALGWGSIDSVVGRPFLDVTGAAPASRNDGATWVGLSVIGFLVGQIAGYLLVVAAAGLTHHNVTVTAKLAAPPEWYVVSSLVGVWIGFGLAPVVASRVAGTRHFVADLGLRFRPIDLLGVPIGIACQYLIMLAYLPFKSHLHDYNAPVTKITGSSHGGGLLLIGVLTVVFVPFFEELFFRGLLLKGLVRVLTPVEEIPQRARLLGVTAAIVLDGVIFALAHFEVQQFAGLAVFGVVLALLSYRTGRLGMNMLAHGSFNLIGLLVATAGIH
jgi:membrane protease YdiL (CAAX protease family)